MVVTSLVVPPRKPRGHQFSQMRGGHGRLKSYFTAFVVLFIVYLTVVNMALVRLELDSRHGLLLLGVATSNNAPLRSHSDTSDSKFVPTLRGKKIFFEITTVGLKQFSYLEHMIDSIRDLCEAGALVDFHIVSSNCNPHPGDNDPECIIKGQSSETTIEDNFSVETISHLNEKIKCRNPEGSLDFKIHLLSPDWGKQLVDHHRVLFYENIDEGYDVFIHTEDDQLIHPTNIVAFLDEMEKLRQLVGDEVCALDK